MGLIGGMARTAVVAGTATAVSNRVSRRQVRRWSDQDQQTYEQAAPPPPAPPPPAAAPPAAQAAGSALSQAEILDQLKQLGELKAAGVLTEEEFAMQKTRVLAGVR